MVSDSGSAGNAADIARMVGLVLVPGAVAEVRALGVVGRPPHTYAGWFNDGGRMVEAVMDGTVYNPRGLYMTLNPVRPELLARCANRIAAAERDLSFTGDADIQRRRWLPLDFDPERPSGICSTDEEHNRALARAEEVEAWLADRGWPAAVRADSGNGAHLMYPIDLPNDDAARQLVEATLQAVAARFGGSGIAVDTKVFNAARIWRVYGTINGKGDDTADRPHRLARLLDVPDALVPVSQEQLQALAAEAPEPAPAAPKGARGRQPFDVDAFLARNAIAAQKSPWKDGTRWVLERCPMSDAHTDGAYIVQLASGAIDAGCHHASCTWGWRELRAKYDTPSEARGGANGGHAEGGRGRQSARERRRVLGPIILRLSDVEAKPITWLWRGRLAVGELTIAIGDPGEGKGLISADLAARVTRGVALPGDPEQAIEPGTVVVLSGEDNPETVLRPRYEAAGADLERVVLVQGKIVLHQPKDGEESAEQRDEPIFLTDLEPLRKVLGEHSPRLLLIDPLQQYLNPETDSRRANQTRPILEALMKLAREFDVAVLALYHMNKDSGQTKAMYRALDSIDIPAAARLMLLVGHSPDDESKRAVVAVKSNLSRMPEGLGFTILADSEDAVPTIEWTGPTDLTQEDILGGGRSRSNKSAKVDEAVTWLLDLLRPLREAGMPPDEVEAAAKEAGISKRTMERAKKQAGAISRRTKGEDGTGWVWSLWTHCWSCHAALGVETHERCATCHWLRCACGACKEGCAASTVATEPESDLGLWVPTNGWSRLQHRQGADRAPNTPGNLAVLGEDHDAQGIATPPNQMVNGGLGTDGGQAPSQVPLPGVQEHAQATPIAAETTIADEQDRQGDGNTVKTAIHEQGWRCCPTLGTNASGQDRQIAEGNRGLGGLAADLAASLPEEATPSPDADEDLNEVTM